MKLINFELVVFVRYTLWNAEYRMSLTRNLEMSCADGVSECETPLESLEVKGGGEEHGENKKVVSDSGFNDSETCSNSSSGTGVFRDLPPQALKYIQQLQSELSNTKEVNLLLIFLFCLHYKPSVKRHCATIALKLAVIVVNESATAIHYDLYLTTLVWVEGGLMEKGGHFFLFKL